MIAFSYGARLALYRLRARSSFIVTGRPPRERPGAAADRDSSWSPDGSQLAFTRTRCPPNSECTSSIYVMTVRGGPPRLLLRNGGDPDWSPDGGRLAFVRTVAGNSDIYVVGIDGRGLRRVTYNPGADLAPDWRPARRAAGDG